MRIKKLELTGFKSFADRTEIELNEGVTCIVGPNGCGKSNLSDAIRWVFGERSAKLLRGTKMEDVIFNGTEFRKPLGMAEVSILLDNSDPTLALQYDEVVLSRRLYRNGQSEYFINRTPCRLKDILDLILDTGMGSNSYSMMEQGRIDFILNADPEERRFLIEEAAGIAKYKVKKEEALRKLERTEQNLLRIRDIIGEVQKNIQYAERQARRAERYKVQLDQLKELEIRKAFLDLSALNMQKVAAEEEKSKSEQGLKSLEEEHQALQKAQQEDKEVLEEILREETRFETRRFELRAELQSVTQRGEFGEERIRECRSRQAGIEREKETLARSLDELVQQAEEREKDKAQVYEQHQAAQEEFQREETLFNQEEAFKEKQAEAQSLKEQIFDVASRLTELGNEVHRLQFLQEGENRQFIRLRTNLDKLGQERAVIEKRKIEWGEERVEIALELERLENERRVLVDHLHSTEKRIRQRERELEEKRTVFQERNSRLQLLLELEETAAEAEQKLLSSLPKESLRGKLVRSLREVLRIRNGYESAVEAVLGSFAQSVIAEDVETAAGLIHELSKAHLGPCGIFVRSLVRPNERHWKAPLISHPQVRHEIADVVEVQKELEPIFNPFFENVYVVENFSPEILGELLPLAEKTKLVTKQGVLLGPDSRIFFRNGKLSPDDGPFQRQAEITRLSESRPTLEREIEALNREKTDEEATEQHLVREKTLREERSQEVRVRKEAAESLLRGIEEREASLVQEMRVLDFEMSESDREARQAGETSGQFKKEGAELEEAKKVLLLRQSEVERTLEELRLHREERLERLARLKTLLENREERFQGAASAEALVKNQREAAQNRLLSITREGQELESRIRELDAEALGLRQKESSLQANQEETEAWLAEIRGRKAFQEEKLRHLLAQFSDRENHLRSLRDTAHERALKMMELSYREKTIFDRLEQSYRVKLGDFKREDSLKGEIDAAALDEEIQTLKQRVESFGPVNLLAMEEYDEMKQRYEFLAGQEKDLNDARESLLEAIRKINRTTRTLFAETFQKVQAAFQDHFQILFGGGRAELLLLDTENPQECGIDIAVRPPGKKLQHITLLSGGEKALTALALLFALFRVKPSPFCVLDEVDAPLDEANIDRFLKVLGTFLDSTQFLIVTHNRKTIAMSDSLYGVTMEESGISKMVSVRVTQNTKEATSEEKLAV